MQTIEENLKSFMLKAQSEYSGSGRTASEDALKKFFYYVIEINRERKLTKGAIQLQSEGVYHGSLINSSLSHYGYIGDNNSLLKNVSVYDVFLLIKSYRSITRGKVRTPIQPKLSNEPSYVSDYNLQKYSDKKLCNELRERGYEVIARKSIEL